jgi:hypothetical protein
MTLGRLGRHARNNRDLRGRVLYLAGADLVVVVQDRRVDGWDCVVISAPPGHATRRRLTVTVDALATATDTITLSPGTQPDRYVALWPLRVRQRWRDGPILPFAGLLVRHCRIPATTTVLMTRSAAQAVSAEAVLTPTRLQHRLAVLTAAGALTDITPHYGQDGHRYALTLPDQ